LLRWRLILGTVFVAAFVGLCWLDYHAALPGVYLLPVGILLGLAGAGELLAMWGRQPGAPSNAGANSALPSPAIVYGGVLLTVLSAGAPAVLPAACSSGPIGRLGWLAIGLIAALLVAVAGEMARYESPGRSTARLALATLAIVYAGGLVGFLVQLRIVDGAPAGGDGRIGMAALLSAIITVKFSDTGQYFAGRLFGRHKLAPRISPGKTWEGVAGGALFAVISAWLAFAWLERSIIGTSGDAEKTGPLAIVAYALAVAAAGLLGDLAESLLKRDSGVKDSSTWMPGFGGVLDMLDSLLVATPVAYLFWALRWVGP
jgi:phosphatidate cytidylyltransferase